MIIGTGTDIVEIKRIEELLERRPFPRKIFTRSEIVSPEEEGLGHKRKVQRLAGLFAAKEAVMKALGTGWGKGAAWTEIAISHTPEGAPEPELSGKTSDIADSIGVENVHISISHTDSLAIAFAILEGKAEEDKRTTDEHG